MITIERSKLSWWTVHRAAQSQAVTDARRFGLMQLRFLAAEGLARAEDKLAQLQRYGRDTPEDHDRVTSAYALWSAVKQ